MEDNRLNININRPLLSVRRFSSISSAPQNNENRKNDSRLPSRPSNEHHKTSIKLDSLLNAGSIPFVWENTPGRPKDESNNQTQINENVPIIPNLPPGRILKPKNKHLDTKKGQTINNFFSRNVLRIKEKPKFESPKSSKKGSSHSDSDDTDEPFMDALDTLSRGESSFYNCSASGVSVNGSDSNPNPSPAGNLPQDRNMRDFMMGRFLPAAKAMASEVSHNTSRKQLFKDKPREIKKIANIDNNDNDKNNDDNNKNKMPQLRYGPTFIQDVINDTEDDEEESDYDYDEHGNKTKFCGLIPRFCSKNSLGIVKLPISPAAYRTHHASSSSISSLSETENEPARTGIYEHRSIDKKPSIETTSPNNYTKPEGSGLFNRLQARGSSLSPSEHNGLRTRKKHSTSFQDLLALNNKIETDDQDLKSPTKDCMIEKTLYVDIVQDVKSHDQDSELANEKAESEFKSYDKKNLKSSYDSFELDFDDDPKRDVKKGVFMDYYKDEKMNDDEKPKASKDRVFELLAPPPLPKSPSDSWLCRTLPSVSSRNAPVRWNNVNPSSDTEPPKSDENVDSRNPQGPLFPIPES